MALSCTSGGKQAEIPQREELPADFTEFYVRFHRDTAFQMSHITWPLKGLSGDLDSEGETKWTRDDWTPHRNIPSSIEYSQTFNILGEDLIVETIRQKQGRNAMQRRFARTSDGWKLIYYVEMQPVE